MLEAWRFLIKTFYLSISSTDSSTDKIRLQAEPFERFHFMTKATAADLRKTILQFGPYNVTLKDLWTLVPPTKLSSAEKLAVSSEDSSFIPGWLSDSVCNLPLFYTAIFSILSSHYEVIND